MPKPVQTAAEITTDVHERTKPRCESVGESPFGCEDNVGVPFLNGDTNGNFHRVYVWLEGLLREEREAIKLRHLNMLAQLRSETPTLFTDNLPTLSHDRCLTPTLLQQQPLPSQSQQLALPPPPQQQLALAGQPQQPLEPARQPQQPLEPAGQPQQPVEPARQPQQLLEPAGQPQQPVEPAGQTQLAPAGPQVQNTGVATLLTDGSKPLFVSATHPNDNCIMVADRKDGHVEWTDMTTSSEKDTWKGQQQQLDAGLVQLSSLNEDKEEIVVVVGPSRNSAGLKIEVATGSTPPRDPISPKSPSRNSNWANQSAGLDFIVTKEEFSGPFAWVSRLVHHYLFDAAFSVLIALNTLTMALEQQYNGIQMGFELGFPEYLANRDATWPWASTFFYVTELLFGSLFTVELILKIIGFNTRFPCDYWNWIDTTIVLSWFVTQAGDDAVLPIDPMVMRLARLLRLLRLLKLTKTIKGFDSLYLMTEAIKGSMSVLIWTVLLLSMVQMLIACVLQQLLEEYLSNVDNPLEARQEVYMYYGTFARTMLTMFEITLGNWMPPCRALVENVSEWYMLFSLCHKLIIGYSVVSVITGVFIQETFKVATTDDHVMLNQKNKMIRVHTKKMEALFLHGDTSKDGFLDKEEFMEVIQDATVKKWLSSMELDVRDAEKLWQLMATGADAQLNAAQLVQGSSRLKGAAKSIDLLTMSSEIRINQQMIQQIHAAIVGPGKQPLDS